MEQSNIITPQIFVHDLPCLTLSQVIDIVHTQ